MQTRVLHQENIHVPDGRQLIQSKSTPLCRHFIFSVTFQNKSTFKDKEMVKEINYTLGRKI